MYVTYHSSSSSGCILWQMMCIVSVCLCAVYYDAIVIKYLHIVVFLATVHNCSTNGYYYI